MPLNIIGPKNARQSFSPSLRNSSRKISSAAAEITALAHTITSDGREMPRTTDPRQP
jgi:hypothetical protein